MHHYRTLRPIIWIRLCAFFYLFSYLFSFALFFFAVYAILYHNQEIMLQLLAGIGIYVTSWILYIWTSSLSKCPLCRSGPMSGKRCAKHRNARAILGSYRLTVALSIIFLNRFRCPYCGESTRLRVKVRDYS
ncbi:MAG: hypothetical protein RL117_849 [Verrucomicrobiota bacterium]|jgi:hypothetical protein